MKKLVIVLMLMPAGVFATAGVQHHPEMHSGAMPMMMDCPMKLPGANVAVLNTPAGVALTFTPDDARDDEGHGKTGRTEA